MAEIENRSVGGSNPSPGTISRSIAISFLPKGGVDYFSSRRRTPSTQYSDQKLKLSESEATLSLLSSASGRKPCWWR